MAALNASSINTIRILTLLRNNSVHVYSSVLRIGMNHSRVDNASGGGLTCGITEDGHLKKYAYKVNGECFIAHPDTGIVFEGHRIPGYESAIELVKKHAINLPQFRLVSWDIAINKDEKPVLLEANLKYGELDFHQLNNGPLFGKDTIDILNEVFQH